MATVTIQKRIRKNHTSYLINYRDPLTGEKRYFKTFKRLRDAQISANDLRAMIDSGDLNSIKKAKTKLNLLTFKEVAEKKCLDWKKRVDRNDIKQVTYEGYCFRVTVLNRAFGKKLLCQITENDLLEYQTEILQTYSATTSNRSLFVIKQIFKHGLELKATNQDPSDEITYLDENQRNNFILPEKIAQLVDVSKQTRAKFYMPAIIYLGAEHGAAKQEALSLEWSDINFDFDGQGIIKLYRTKNKYERTEFMMPRTRQALLDWKDHLEFKRRKCSIEVIDQDFVFCRLDGTPIKGFGSAWRTICQIVGLPDFHYHDLRHTFASNLLLSGSGIKDVKEMMGHKDISMTDRYAHINLQHRNRRQKQLAIHYGNGVR